MNYKIASFILASVVLSSCGISKQKFDDLLAQKQKLEGELKTKNQKLDVANASVSKLSESLKKAKYKVDSLKNLGANANNLSALDKKAQELEQALSAKDKALQDLKSQISSSLSSFNENELIVNNKNGKVYVSLADQLVFRSGSTEVNRKGVTALKQLAKSLKDRNDINTLVEGHTDNVKISNKKKYLADNWDLSVLRASSITKILVSGGMSPSQITSAGRGEFSPVAANDSPENKRKNRRTEIIISPKVDDVLKIIEAD